MKQIYKLTSLRENKCKIIVKSNFLIKTIQIKNIKNKNN